MDGYALLRAASLPRVETRRTVTPSPHDGLGVKGVGEAGAIAAPPAVVNATLDALAPLGVEEVDTPLTRASASGAPSTTGEQPPTAAAGPARPIETLFGIRPNP